MCGPGVHPSTVPLPPSPFQPPHTYQRRFFPTISRETKRARANVTTKLQHTKFLLLFLFHQIPKPRPSNQTHLCTPPTAFKEEFVRETLNLEKEICHWSDSRSRRHLAIIPHADNRTIVHQCQPKDQPSLTSLSSLQHEEPIYDTGPKPRTLGPSITNHGIGEDSTTSIAKPLYRPRLKSNGKVRIR
jgi:hypothetical protein